MAKRSIRMMEVKQALHDERFRETLPESLKEKVEEFVKNPGCACNVPLYREILKNCKSQLEMYYPGIEISDEAEEIKRLAENNWTVISCNIRELEGKLKKLSPGRKQIAVSRFQDQVTVVVNELDIIY